jgi:hypothetical protein
VVYMQGSHLEQVVKVSTKKVKTNSTEDASLQQTNSSNIAWEGAPSDAAFHAKDTASTKENVEQDVDRLIDSESNEYVLSRAKGGVSLTLDPLLVQVCALASNGVPWLMAWLLFTILNNTGTRADAS